MTSVSLQEFIAQNHQKKGRVSKLTPFKDDILFLKNNGYSQEQILGYLRQNGLVVGMTTLNSFIKKHNQTNSNVQISPLTIPQPEATEATETGSQGTTASKRPKGIKKFQWTQATTDGLI